MLDDFLDYFELNGVRAQRDVDQLRFGQRSVPIRNDIPRFTPDASYSTGNFSLLRDRHATLQLDSKNGTTDRLQTILERTRWPREFFAGKTVLECGCGAGPDTEILRSLGARVLSVDIAGIDVAQGNLGIQQQHCLIQADIADLPLRKASFDIVFCHRVLQHTPSPRKTLQAILSHVKPDGAVFVHSYSCEVLQLLRWKYALRPLTRRVSSEKLYRWIERAGPTLYRVSNGISRVPGGRLFAWIFIPFLNYRHKQKFASWSDAAIVEFGVHDTFDALSPRYDRPMPRWRMSAIAARWLKRPFEVVNISMVNVLRTRV